MLSPMLFNMYIISDLPETNLGSNCYADDLCILLRRPSWKEMEEGLNKDMTILDNKRLLFQQAPNYLGVRLDQMLELQATP